MNNHYDVKYLTNNQSFKTAKIFPFSQFTYLETKKVSAKYAFKYHNQILQS